MLKSRDEVMCWLVSHEEAVLAVGHLVARVVDKSFHADGVTMKTALSLMQPPRAAWFDVEVEGRRTLMRIGDAGAVYHERLIKRKKCSCPRRAGGGRD